MLLNSVPKHLLKNKLNEIIFLPRSMYTTRETCIEYKIYCIRQHRKQIYLYTNLILTLAVPTAVYRNKRNNNIS